MQIDPEIYQILTWSTTCCMWRVEKILRSEEKKTYLFTKCKKTLGKIFSLPSAKGKHSANLLLCRVPLMDTQQTPNGRHTNWRISTWRFFAVYLCFAECFFLVCRVVFFQHSAKSLVCQMPLFCRVWFLQHSANNFFYRVPDGMHSANTLVLSKSPVSGSDLLYLIKFQ